MSRQSPVTSAKAGIDNLKKRLLFVLGAIIVYRVGSHIPVPGIDPVKLANFFSQRANTIFGLFNMFSGGALRRFTVFSLGIMPYISSSIVVQLMTVVVPSLEQIKKEGENGRRKINQYTRFGTIFLAIFQAIGLAKYLSASDINFITGPGFYFLVTVTLVTGTMFLMWLGEQVTERGIGNGISILIFSGIVAGLPDAVARTFQQVREGQLMSISLLMLAAMVVLVVSMVVFIERGQRRIVVNYAKRHGQNNQYSNQMSHLPLKINMAGVIPPIFASSLIFFPATIAQFVDGSKNFAWLSDLTQMIAPGQPLYLILFAVAIVFFAFFYTALVYNPKDTSDTLKRGGAFIPGIRPGEQTTNYIDGVMTRLTLAGAIYLVIVSLFPELLVLFWNVPFHFGGTSLLIIVVVIMDFMTQIQTHLMSLKYESMMKKVNFRKRS